MIYQAQLFTGNWTSASLRLLIQVLPRLELLLLLLLLVTRVIIIIFLLPLMLIITPCMTIYISSDGPHLMIGF